MYLLCEDALACPCLLVGWDFNELGQCALAEMTYDEDVALAELLEEHARQDRLVVR